MVYKESLKRALLKIQEDISGAPKPSDDAWWYDVEYYKRKELMKKLSKYGKEKTS